MPETPPSPDKYPVYYANVVTVHVSVDEVTLECRRYMPEHKEIWRLTQGGKQAPPALTDEQVYNVPPVAKVVMTFTAARLLRDNLTELLQQIEQQRK